MKKIILYFLFSIFLFSPYVVSGRDGRKGRKSEIALQTFGNEQGQPILSSHGFGHYWGEVLPYIKGGELSDRYIFDTDLHNLTTFNYPDANIGYKEKITLKIALNFKFDQVSLGQENDLQRINTAAKSLNNPNTIGFGVSRGAAAIINFMGTTPSPNIKALVLDSPFATIKDTIKHRMVSKYFLYAGKISLLAKLAHRLAAAIFPQYDPKGLQPLDTIDTIDPDIPIIFLHSKEDTLVPCTASRQLYIKRKLLGCNNVYLVELEHGVHAKALHGPDGEIFQNAVHAFYKRYGYPYNPEFADKINLDDHQPLIAEVMCRQ